MRMPCSMTDQFVLLYHILWGSKDDCITSPNLNGSKARSCWLAIKTFDNYKTQSPYISDTFTISTFQSHHPLRMPSGHHATICIVHKLGHIGLHLHSDTLTISFPVVLREATKTRHGLNVHEPGRSSSITRTAHRDPNEPAWSPLRWMRNLEVCNKPVERLSD